MQESTMYKSRPLPSTRIERIHIPPLRGKPLVLLPEGILVRWPDRTPAPHIGDEVAVATAHVPRDLRDDVWLVLFGQHALARCDAAKRLSERKSGRRLLTQILSRSSMQKMLAAASRLAPELRE